ncbi:DUF4440 domain-containing protein [Halobium palmae]|uniref:DUF4440 domain-containing protein n=1 Tax=Halobium palmae TaxID=1776492 RepID=A0ABD5RXF9_9EURY
MGIKQSLLKLERQLWNADEEFYQETLAEDAVMVFPAPTGILTRTDILGSLSGGDRWRSIDFSEVRVIEIGDGTAQLVYRAAAERTEDGSEYSALIATTYLQENGTWSLISHQQTPVGE